MPQVFRTGPTPAFFEYVCKRALTNPGTPLPIALQQLNVTPVRIPSFQRGIEWGEEEVVKFLNSESVLFGNAVVGMFPNNEPGVLVDGLQRFAIGTALLSSLYDRVLSPQPNNPAAAAHFVRLHVHVQHFQPVYAHNHAQFLNHNRRAISTPYRSLCREVDRLIDGVLLQPQRVAAEAAKITAAMLDKQIAVDEYWNFSSQVELANTFIGLNTVRVELGPVDLIRAYVVDAATGQNWPSQDIARIENDITARFTQAGKTRPELVPTATVVLKCLQSRDGLAPDLIFPAWPAITPAAVDQFLDFVDRMLAVSDRRAAAASSVYLREIRECGYLPFAFVILFYYRQLLQTGTLPPFFAAANTAADADLHNLLRAVYRVVLEGRVGRTGEIAERIARDAYTTLSGVADAVTAATSSGPLTGPPGPNWLKTYLAQADSKRARRVFNACLLPDRTQPGGPFAPLPFGTRGTEWQVDHLLPEANLQPNQPGYPEADSLRNFAPLPQPVNRANANTPCSQKLAAGGRTPRVWRIRPMPSILIWFGSRKRKVGLVLTSISRRNWNRMPRRRWEISVSTIS